MAKRVWGLSDFRVLAKQDLPHDEERCHGVVRVINEALRFVRVAHRWDAAGQPASGPEMAALKRASMDLTRALPELRGTRTR